MTPSMDFKPPPPDARRQAVRYGPQTVDGARFMAESQSENDFMRAVMDHARLRGWIVYHTHIAKRSAFGFPDLTMVRDGRLVFAELKREIPQKCAPSQLAKVMPTPAQVQWLAALATVADQFSAVPLEQAPVTAFLWRPSDWPQIERILE